MIVNQIRLVTTARTSLVTTYLSAAPSAIAAYLLVHSSAIVNVAIFGYNNRLATFDARFGLRFGHIIFSLIDYDFLVKSMPVDNL